MIEDPTNLFLETSPTIFSVSEISHALKKSIEEKYSCIKIRGEISGLKKHSSGHIYYALKDDNAVMDAVSWRGTYSNSPIPLEDGLEIVATGRITTYPARSKYQLIVESFEATGQGALLKLLEERKQKLTKEGLFDPALKKRLPPYPQTIGVITSPTGAVIRDILHRLADRFPCHVIVWPVLVQGPGAAEQVAHAINGFNALTNKPDLLIVARGGGSLEDLWAFNEEIVVRAAANSEIPLISAIGHETDTTLIDYASDLRAPTPTGAAELAVPVMMDILAYLQDRSYRQQNSLLKILEQYQLKINYFEKGIPDPKHLIEEYAQRLDDWIERLQKSFPQFCTTLKDRLTILSTNLRSPVDLLQRHQERLDFLIKRLEQSSFQSILERGFCLATNEKGQTIDTATKFPNSIVSLQFKDGNVNVLKTKSSPSTPTPKKRKAPSIEHPTLF